MMVLIRRRRPGGRMESGLLNLRRIDMIWETPQATEFRFGMEITMYIANR
jgi:coenzyme PQQ precursor peptide PqqA